MAVGRTTEPTDRSDTGPLAFGAARSELPIMYVFLALASVELLVVHFLMGLWSPAAAWVLSALTLLGGAQIIRIVQQIKHRPTLVTERSLLVRTGDRADLDLPWSSLASVDPIGFGPKPAGPDVLDTTFFAHPNVGITLAKPFARRKLGRDRRVRIVALRVDEPDVFIDAVKRYLNDGAAEEHSREAMPNDGVCLTPWSA